MEGILARYLYHGTDARIIKMSDEDRASLRENLFITLDYLWELSSPYYDPFDYNKLEPLEHQMDEDVFDNFRRALNHENARRRGSKQWQYQNNVIYHTSIITYAAYYAYHSYVFGELGKNTWDIYLGIRALSLESWHPIDLVVDTLNTLKQLAEGTPEPVIFALDFSMFDKTKLKEDTGEDYDEFSQIFSYESDDSFSLTYRGKKNVVHLQPGKELTL